MKGESVILSYLIAILWIQFIWNVYSGYREVGDIPHDFYAMFAIKFDND